MVFFTTNIKHPAELRGTAMSRDDSFTLHSHCVLIMDEILIVGQLKVLMV